MRQGTQLRMIFPTDGSAILAAEGGNTSSKTALATRLIKSGGTPTLYIFSKCAFMSRPLIPNEYI
jgi:hypothetical protein